jgi:hypothetical protein
MSSPSESTGTERRRLLLFALRSLAAMVVVFVLGLAWFFRPRPPRPLVAFRKAKTGDYYVYSIEYADHSFEEYRVGEDGQFQGFSLPDQFVGKPYLEQNKLRERDRPLAEPRFQALVEYLQGKGLSPDKSQAATEFRYVTELPYDWPRLEDKIREVRRKID